MRSQKVGHNLATEQGFPGGSDSKKSACNAGDPGSIPGLARFPGEGNGYSPQYSCLENSMEKELSPWDPKQLGMTERLTHTHTHTHTHKHIYLNRAL